MAKTNDPALVVAEYNARMPDEVPTADRVRMSRLTLDRLRNDAMLFGIYAYKRLADGAIERVPPSELAFDRKTQTYSRRAR